MTERLITTQTLAKHANKLLAVVVMKSVPVGEQRAITDYRLPDGPRFSISLVEPSRTESGMLTVKYDGEQVMRAKLDFDWLQDPDNRVTATVRMPANLAEEFMRVGLVNR